MRIHGILFRGLEGLPGEHELVLDAGYSAVLTGTRERASALWSLVRALLYPDVELPRLRQWSSGGRGLAIMSITLRGGML